MEFCLNLLKVSSSPHIRSNETTRSIMTDVLIALTPSLLWGIYIFGFRVAVIAGVAVVAAMLSEFLYQFIQKREITVLDMSAAVTGLLLALNLPVSVPLWIPLVGSFFAIIIVKQLFGGIGKNFINPALAARIFLLSWPEDMQTYVKPFTKLPAFVFNVTEQANDAISGATSMSTLSAGLVDNSSVLDNFYGFIPGSIGEISKLMLLLGFVYLLLRKVVTTHIPLSFIATVFVGMGAYSYFNGQPAPLNFALNHVLSGGLLIGAIFMATDYTTSPVTASGKVIFGIGCGLITIVIRLFGGYPEGVSFAILIMNTLVWHIDKWTRPKPFGALVKEKQKK